MKAESVVSPSLLGACEAIVCNAARNCQDLLFREAMLRHNDQPLLASPHILLPFAELATATKVRPLA